VKRIQHDLLNRNSQGKTNIRQQSINDILQAAFQILTYEKVSPRNTLVPQSLTELDCEARTRGSIGVWTQRNLHTAEGLSDSSNLQQPVQRHVRYTPFAPPRDISLIIEPIISPKLYFVKVDVQACFDTIEQSKLLQILRDVLSGVCYARVS
jgi:hypothetical protein